MRLRLYHGLITFNVGKSDYTIRMTFIAKSMAVEHLELAPRWWGLNKIV